MELKKANWKNKIGFIAAFFAVSMAGKIANAQDGKITQTEKNDTIKVVEDVIFVIVEQMPEFPDGEKALHKFLIDNIVYPKEAREKKLDGRVVIGFVVEPDGSLTNFTIVRGVDPILNEEALRVAKLMPNWNPGKQRGKPVRVQFMVPITITFQ